MDKESNVSHHQQIPKSHLRASLQVTMLASRYQLGKLLGKGQYGSVYEAIDTTDGSFVAIKDINVTGTSKAQVVAMKQESEMLKRLTHPNVLKMIDCIVDIPGHYYMIMELLENGSLTHIVKQFGVFPESLAGLYIRQILEGLSFVHDHGVIHRDVKGQNIMLSKDGCVVLGDFGVAQFQHENQAELKENMAGSPYWMAPEVILLMGHSPASDIWSLGCTVIELMIGEPPYFDLQPMQAMFKIVQEEGPPLPTDISPELEAFLMNCFEKDPTRRPTAKELLKHPWIHHEPNRRTLVKHPTVADLQHGLTLFNKDKPENKRKLARTKSQIKREKSLGEMIQVVQDVAMEQQNARELIREMTFKLQEVLEKSSYHDSRLSNLNSLEKIYRKMFTPKETAELLKKLQVEKDKVETSMNILLKCQRDLQSQIQSLKETAYHRVIAIKDFSDPDMEFNQGDPIWVIEEENSMLWLGENILTGRTGFFPPSFVALRPIETEFRIPISKNLGISQAGPNSSNYGGTSPPKSPNIVEGSRDILGEVKKQERMDKLQKFFGENSNSLEKPKMATLHGKKSDKRDVRGLREKVKELEDRCKDSEEKAREYEDKFVIAKMQLSNAQIEIAELQREIWHLKKELKTCQEGK